MQKKWYIGALVVMLSLLGMIKEQQTLLPNQEIVLQFSSSAISSEEIHDALTIIEGQLQEVGAQNIQVTESNLGILKISYYSDSDVSLIKGHLIDNQIFKLNNSSGYPKERPFEVPNENDDVAYQLDVYELKKTSDSGRGFDGNLAASPEIKSDRLLYSEINFIVAWLVKDTIQTYSNNSYKYYQNVALSLDDGQGNIPEVRAGPFS